MNRFIIFFFITFFFILSLFIFQASLVPSFAGTGADNKVLKASDYFELSPDLGAFKNSTGNIQALWKKLKDHLALNSKASDKKYSCTIEIIKDPGSSYNPDDIRPKKAGWPKKINEFDLNKAHSINDIKEYLNEKHAPGIFDFMAKQARYLEFHYGMWPETRDYLYSMGVRCVVKVSRVTPFAKTVFFFAYDKTGAVFGGASNVFGSDRFDHLLLQARFGLHLSLLSASDKAASDKSGAATFLIYRILHRPVNTWQPWYEKEFSKVISRALKQGPLDMAVVGYRGSVMNGLLSRKRAELLINRLRHSAGAVLFSDTAAQLKEFYPQCKDLVQKAQNLARVIDNIDESQVSDIYTSLDMLNLMVYDFPDLLKGIKGLFKGKAKGKGNGKGGGNDSPVLKSSKLQALYNKMIQARDSVNLTRDLVFIEGPDHEFLPYLKAYCLTDDNKVKSLVLFRNIYGDSSRFFAKKLKKAVKSKTLLFSSCGALNQGARVGDIYLPSGIAPPIDVDIVKYNNPLIDNPEITGFYENNNNTNNSSNTSNSSNFRIIKNAVSKSVYSPLVETLDFLKALKEKNVSLLDGELESFFIGWGEDNPFASLFIASDLPGTDSSLSEMVLSNTIFNSQRAAVSIICKYLNIKSLIIPGEKKYPLARQGFFFGTFDPVHEGHLSTARKSAEHAGLDQVLMIPNYVSEHKPGASGFSDRHHMMVSALSNEPKLATLPAALIEKAFNTDGVTQMIKDIKTLKTADHVQNGKRGTLFYQIMGTDSFEKLLDYGLAREVCKSHIILVVMRKGYDFTPGADYFLKTHKGRCIVIDDQSIPMVSSSAVRRAVIKGSEAEEKDIKSLEYIKEPVKKYILEKGLYKN